MPINPLPEVVERLDEPVYRPYAVVRSMLAPGTTVLDVGCGNAKVSEYLARSGAVVDGIEPSCERAEQAEGRIRHISTVPAGEPDPSLRAGYDLVTFFDVLEHMPDPAAVLSWAVTKLKPGGHIVAVVPNSAHYLFRWKMLRGDWSMGDWGLFDRTHIRFFDTRTMRALRPAGVEELLVEFTAPGWEPSTRRRIVQQFPNLFALHGTMVWRGAE